MYRSTNMDKAREFYRDFLSKENHILGGSIAIKKQIQNFREPKDIDIILEDNVIERLLCSKIDNIKKSDYGEGIYSITFEDDSKIDLIKFSLDTRISVNIKGVKYLSIDQIIKHKILLIEKSINNKMFNEHNKHLQDLIFINKNYDK